MTREISFDMTFEEQDVLMEEPDSESHVLSPAARAALLSAAPDPGGLGACHFTCSVDVGRELLEWVEAGRLRWYRDNPLRSAMFRRAVRQIRFGLWRVREGPPPESVQLPNPPRRR